MKERKTDREESATAQRFCKECVKYSSCALRHDDRLRKDCVLFEESIPLSYRNSEGYPDPTSYFALRNLERERRANRNAEQTREKRACCKKKSNAKVAPKTNG